MVKEKTNQVKDAMGNALGATKEKANEAGEHIQEKTAEAKEAADAKAEAAKARGEYTADDEWVQRTDEAFGKETQDDVFPKARETKEDAKGILGGFTNILGEASMVIQDTVNAPGERVSDQ
jgi:membrane protein involved in colicin uptake